MKPSELVPPADLPVSDARIPALTVRAVMVVVGILLTVLVYGAGGWVAVGVIFTVLAAWMPEYLISWLVIVFLAIGQLARPADLNWKLLVLIAGLQLMHVLGSLALAFPWRSWVQPGVFARPLIRFVAIQVPVQVLAAVALPLLAPKSDGHHPVTVAAFTIVGAAALGVLALLMLRLGVRQASPKPRMTVDVQANQTPPARHARSFR